MFSSNVLKCNELIFHSKNNHNTTSLKNTNGIGHIFSTSIRQKKSSSILLFLENFKIYLNTSNCNCKVMDVHTFKKKITAGNTLTHLTLPGDCYLLLATIYLLLCVLQTTLRSSASQARIERWGLILITLAHWIEQLVYSQCGCPWSLTDNKNILGNSDRQTETKQ